MTKNNFQKTAIRNRRAQTGEVFSVAKRALAETTWFDLYREGAGGFSAGLHVIASRPGMGTTAFMMNVMGHFQKPLFLTLDLSALAIRKRFADGIELTKVAVMESSEGFIEDFALMTEKFDAVFIDYVQLMSMTMDSKQTQTEKMEGIIAALHQIAIDNNLPIFVASQVNRTSADTTSFPELDSLRGTGSLAEVADSVTMLRADSDAFYFKVVKSRRGVVGTTGKLSR
jgi:replicative DNA helicase